MPTKRLHRVLDSCLRVINAYLSRHTKYTILIKIPFQSLLSFLSHKRIISFMLCKLENLLTIYFINIELTPPPPPPPPYRSKQLLKITLKRLDLIVHQHYVLYFLTKGMMKLVVSSRACLRIMTFCTNVHVHTQQDKNIDFNFMNVLAH